MGQADTIEADKGCLPCFTGKQPGKIRRRKSQPACQFLHGKTPVKVFLHISDAFRNRSRWFKKGRGFQRAQQAGKEAVDQFAAFVAFQLTAFPQFPVQIQQQEDGKAVCGQRKAGAEGGAYFGKKGSAAGP